MARQSRLKYEDPRSGYYHIVTRTVLKSFLLDEIAKEEFLSILRKLSQVYFVKVVSFAIMSNHVHLIVRMLPQEEISDAELRQRHDRYYNEGKTLSRRRFDPNRSEYFRARFGDLSKFMQDLKQRFSRWYNKRMNNHGHIWGERFTSVLLEAGRALTACMIYVELNSLRAGLVS
ncbi:transposase, partial [bacterium]|nr:transposase [bacterium]